MSNAVEQILAKSRVTLTVDGVEFVARKITTPIVVKVLGTKALGLVRAAQREGKEIDEQQNMDVIRAYLTECMVIPRLGAETDPGAGVVAFEDLGDIGPQLFAELLKASGWGQQLADFQKPSEGETE